MKTLHYSIIAILFVFVLANIEPVFADIDSTQHLNVTTTNYGGNGIMVNSNQNVSPFLPSPPLGMYPYTSKIFSVFQIDPEIIRPNDTSTIHILVTNNANFTLYDVTLGESVNDSKSIMFSNIHKIDILNPNKTKTIFGTLYVSAYVQPTDYYDIWWNVVAKNQTGNMMESMQFHRNLPIAQNLPQYCCDKPVTITLETPLKQFEHGTIPRNVTCWQGFQLIFKAEDSSPACVKPDTAQKLTERGWALNYTDMVGKESISLSAYQGVSNETFYNNGTVASDFTIDVNIHNFKPSNTSLVLQVYYNDGTLYKTVSVPSGTIQPDGFYKYHLIGVSDENHPVPFKVVATYNKETAVTYVPVFAHP